MKPIVFVGLLMAVLIMLAGCSDKSSTGPEDEVFQNATAEQFDVAMLERAFESAAQAPRIRSLAVSRDGAIVAEAYYNGGSSEADDELHVMSVTKSVTATLVGIAIAQGFISGVDQTLSDFLGAEVDTVNAALGQVTLHQLMTMSCGHRWAEITESSEFSDWLNADDPWIYIFEKPILDTPGTVFDYSDGAAHLVSVIIEKATGMNTSDFADEYLWEPMGLGPRFWYGDKRGSSLGGVGLRIGTHDMLAFGQLWLDGGVWQGRRIVPEEWVDSCWQSHMNSSSHIADYPGYGYFWWLKTIDGHACQCAIGYGGQFIFVCADYNLVVAATGDYRNCTAQQAGQNWAAVSSVILNQVFPSLR